MAETCIIRIRDIPTRKLRKKVRGFLKGEGVSVEDEYGQLYAVSIERNKLVLKSDGMRSVLNLSGITNSEHPHWKHFMS
ncbi:MAG: hypothetical protein ACXADL_02240 [Candidatus Thorarchaeota archaeon]|jgi:hypothetical protein